MIETNKVTIVVVAAILISVIGLAIKGVFGAVMGFLLTLLVVGFFVVWKKYSNSN